jgi:hypothetical protein
MCYIIKKVIWWIVRLNISSIKFIYIKILMYSALYS